MIFGKVDIDMILIWKIYILEFDSTCRYNVHYCSIFTRRPGSSYHSNKRWFHAIHSSLAQLIDPRNWTVQCRKDTTIQQKSRKENLDMRWFSGRIWHMLWIFDGTQLFFCWDHCNSNQICGCFGTPSPLTIRPMPSFLQYIIREQFVH